MNLVLGRLATLIRSVIKDGVSSNSSIILFLPPTLYSLSSFLLKFSSKKVEITKKQRIVCVHTIQGTQTTSEGIHQNSQRWK